MGRLPDDFATHLAAVLDPVDAEASGRVLGEAVAGLDDDRLAGFLSALAERVRAGGHPVRAAEVRALLDAARAGEA